MTNAHAEWVGSWKVTTTHTHLSLFACLYIAVPQSHRIVRRIKMHNLDPSLDRYIKIVWRVKQVSECKVQGVKGDKNSYHHNFSAKKIKTLKKKSQLGGGGGQQSIIHRFLLSVLGDLGPNSDDKWGMGILVRNNLSAKWNIKTTVKVVFLIQAAM
jgi:hypothetical protein